MKLFAKRLATGLTILIVLSILLGATYLTSQKRPPVLAPGAVFCDSTGQADSATYRMVFYLDLNSCLSCNEDMDAWRELCSELIAKGGRVLVYAKRSDSADVAWAMHLEGISDTTRVLDDEIVRALGWQDMGTPVKLLLDKQCRTLKIDGWMGNRKQSRQFLEDVMEQVCGPEPKFTGDV